MVERSRTKASRTASRQRRGADCSLKFNPVALGSIFDVLDAVAWMSNATPSKISQFANIDPRTVGKVLKNTVTLGITEHLNGEFSLRLPYPPKGSEDEKKAVLKESLYKMPLLRQLRQFRKLGDDASTALRKAATLSGVENYNEAAMAPLLKWARELGAVDAENSLEDLVDEAVIRKEERHLASGKQTVAFLSHSSRDKPFIRKLAADLNQAGIDVWFDEQTILVGDSMTEKIGQGLAQSDFFVIALSKNSVSSTWVQKELNNAVIQEVERRAVTVLPIKLDDCDVPAILRDKKYADFSKSYRNGFDGLLRSMKK
ncbi:hypothetical protein BH20VER1_BH20VER1_05470 [soil metagenome]